MKLILAIVNDDDCQKVINDLNKNGIGVTKLCSSGGFLKSGNTTLLIGVDESKLEEAIDLIKKNSKSRKQFVNASMVPNAMGGMFSAYPVEVTIGGATIFVLNVEGSNKF
ncbi:hypothetical protein CDQ84_15960 [Clostridium thermosuccinogenes]|uniref:Transcriptional regulator n=1 Tax=Clostridium thermosuccinogenes TaxID=84032 RepID=A0A2K2F8S1_9CLOT|nr:cyclic-di-AMP receptor [Pseudoclostridium thermosuccinogenes]AUS95893.1 hypothetical protein CDO33_05230 [Pseudoclostridium thermosuccinogenes]PNT93390.1 hypothetical protein CDQ83_07730 [Pseudoclostridium thermosuccinogenes]PNT95158.1 hypothetical protein CDQ85_15820 [Pseudoclostridium thermosuccinogenes]PNT96012.1 hypothetical protein CDQ84_15960 [Pseudoclostridium thermosuccinogenes]